MLNSCKVAIARIFSDLIKADRIIDTGEMKYWRTACVKYEIDRDVRIKAKEISFANAVNTICRSSVHNLKESFLEDCRSMTVSDGFCSHSEALLMVSLTSLLKPDMNFRSEVISIPKSNFN
ncbi:MAG: hypothetical protein K2I44_06275, partial [Muribaculaceae bacterium]|nr:hypothetical protein [Muribaculaceae bacterium]